MPITRSKSIINIPQPSFETLNSMSSLNTPNQTLATNIAPIINSSTLNPDPTNITQSTSHIYKGEWYPYNKDEESDFLPFTSFENAEQQLTYEYLISIGKNII